MLQNLGVIVFNQYNNPKFGMYIFFTPISISGCFIVSYLDSLNSVSTMKNVTLTSHN